MFTIEATALLLVLVLSLTPNHSPLVPDSPLDQYGTIPWEDEKARLDQLFIQLQHRKNLIGYILVVEAINGCPREAQARAIRAKRYLVEHRGVANNRLIWKVSGYSKQLSTTLLLAPPEYTLSYGYGATISGKAGPLNKSCKSKLERIKKSRWGAALNKRLEGSRHERASLVSCGGELLKRSVMLLSLAHGH